MRVWIDPNRMAEMRISPSELIQAIQQENIQAAAGKIGGARCPGPARSSIPITVKGRLTKASEFEKIVVRRNDDGSIVHLKDVARVELDSENYETAGWLNGKPAGASRSTSRRRQRPGRSSSRSASRWTGSPNFPEGLEYRIAYDTTHYVRENITEVGTRSSRHSFWC